MPTSNKNNLFNEALISSDPMYTHNDANEDTKEVESKSEYESFDIGNGGNEIKELVDLLISEQDSDPCTTTDKDSNSVIKLEATLNIQNVVNLYERLKKSYAENNAIEINVSQVNSIDTSTLQLLFALKKDAIKNQKKVIFIQPSLKFVESARLLGLLEELEIQA
ncbi:MAG: STAS domain-containing protein [Methylococcales bacterium]|jgi:anti-anti-sigma regulatory factor|nr:STAS domain-containing protein [Methylococcales bacterium]